MPGKRKFIAYFVVELISGFLVPMRGMFKRTVAFLLIPLLIGVSFSRLFIYASFEINRTYIASNLCENRDKPWMHCEGKCYLMKKLKQAEEREKSQEQQQQKNLIQDSFLPETFTVMFATRLLRVISMPDPHFIPSAHLSLIFQPPQSFFS